MTYGKSLVSGMEGAVEGRVQATQFFYQRGKHRIAGDRLVVTQEP